MTHDPRHPDPKPLAQRAISAATGVLLLALVVGCDTLSGLPRAREAAPHPSHESDAGTRLAQHVDTLLKLSQGTASEQAEIVASLRGAYEQSRTPGEALRYGLALASPGHAAHDPAQAQRLLKEALAAPERLAPVERGLALLELQRVSKELQLREENLRLTDELQREHGKDKALAASAVATKRLQAEIEENVKLRRALDEARAKLDAIATIEQDSPDRQTPTEGRRP